MQLSPTPDLSPWRRMLLAAIAASIIAAVSLTFTHGANLSAALGDTDDAMRLVLVRGLASGTGWWDQHMTRLQPPLGVYMHWSRLMDGGLVALYSLFRIGLPPAAAEIAMRFTWPLLWILPAAWGAIAIARRLGGGAAVFACAIVLAANLPMFLQFRPGRVDHHDVQITMAVLALAGAALGTVRGALLAGAATGLGLAVGLEALAFEIAVGGFFALHYLMEEDEGGKRLRAYAGALGLATVGFFLIQTPPWRWSFAACDAIAVNLVAGIALVGAGLVVAVQLTRNRDWRARLGALALVGIASAALYIGLDPNCLNGPFADVDPRLKVFWLPNVQEIRGIPRVWPRDHATAFTLMTPCVMGLIAWGWMAKGREKGTADPFLFLVGVILLAASATGWSAIRMASYANWFAVPLIAAAAAGLVARWAKGAMLVTAAAALLVVPMFASEAAAAVDKQVKAWTAPKPKVKAAPKPKAKAKAPARRAPAGLRGDRCFRTGAYVDLAKQPAGIVLSEIDLGPFVLANTPSSALAAPYHRMNWGLVAVREALSTEAEAAHAAALKLKATYVLECVTHKGNADRVGMKPDSLQKKLDAGQPPSWLEPVSVAGPLRLYRVRPTAAAPAPPASAK